MNKWKVGDEVERVAVTNKRSLERYPDEYYMGQPARIIGVSQHTIIFRKKLRTTEKYVDGSLYIKDFNSNFQLVTAIQENE